MIVHKFLLGTLATLTLAGAYAFHDGVVRLSVDEHQSFNKERETHLHLILPAALLPAAAHFVPEEQLRHAASEVRPYLPAIRFATQELARLPDCDLVEVLEGQEHVQIRTRGGKLLVDVESPEETVHVAFPLHTLDQLAQQIATASSGSS